MTPSAKGPPPVKLTAQDVHDYILARLSDIRRLEAERDALAERVAEAMEIIEDELCRTLAGPCYRCRALAALRGET